MTTSDAMSTSKPSHLRTSATTAPTSPATGQSPASPPRFATRESSSNTPMTKTLSRFPVKTGNAFKEPSRAAKRKATKRKKELFGDLDFDAAEINLILKATSPQLKAATLLGINCACGNTDFAHLTRRIVDRRPGWLDYAREKNGIERKCCVWPETLSAIDDAWQVRPAPADPEFADYVFLTKYGNPWTRTVPSKKSRSGYTSIDSLSTEYNKMLSKLNLKRCGRNFYSLRRTFATVAETCRTRTTMS